MSSWNEYNLLREKNSEEVIIVDHIENGHGSYRVLEATDWYAIDDNESLKCLALIEDNNGKFWCGIITDSDEWDEDNEESFSNKTLYGVFPPYDTENEARKKYEKCEDLYWKLAEAYEERTF